MRTRMRLWILLLLCWAALWGVAAPQTQERLYLQADSVKSEDGKTVASGHVRAEIAGVRLDCDYLEYEEATGIVAARGDCVFYFQDSFLAAESIDFNTRAEMAHLEKVSGRARDFLVDRRNVQEDLFFWADAVDWRPEKVEAVNATLTSCSYPPGRTDYTLESSLLEIFPQDRITASDAKLVLGDTPIYTLPTVNLSLTSRAPQRVQPFFPLVGQNGVDGLFLRNSFDYTIGDSNYGQLLLDVYQHSGLGAGLKHHYELGDVGGGDFYLYQLRGRQSNRSRYQINSNTALKPDPYSDLTLNYSANKFELPGFVSPAQENAQINYTRDSDVQKLQVLANYSRLGDNQNVVTRLFYHLNLTEELSTRWAADYYRTTTAIGGTTNRYHLLGSLLHQSELFDTALDLERSGGDGRFYYLNRSPEISLRSKSLYLGPVPLQVAGSFGSLYESPSQFGTTRSDFKLTIPDQTIDLGSGRILAGGGARQMLYGSGDAQYVLAARGSYLQNLGSHAVARIDYNWQDPNGYSPFQHDLQFEYQTITGGLEFYHDDRWKFGALAGYDLNGDRLHDLIPRLDVHPVEGFRVVASSNYDPNFKLWRSVDSQLRFNLTDNVSVASWNLYDLVNQRITYQDYQLNVEQHDWTASVVYRGVQNEVYFQFSLKAFPLQQPSLGPTWDRPILPNTNQPYLR